MTLNAIIKLPSNGEDVVIRAVDITVSGAIKDHVTTKEEVIKFMARSGSDYDQMFMNSRQIELGKRGWVKRQNKRRTTTFVSNPKNP